MKKNENLRSRAMERIAQETKRKSSWLFPVEFGDSRFEYYRKFTKRFAAQSTKPIEFKNQPSKPSAEQKRIIRAKAKEKIRFSNRVIKGFKSSSFYRQLEQPRRGVLMTLVREVVSEFIAQSTFMGTVPIALSVEELSNAKLEPILVNTLFVNEGYTLFGAATGHMYPIRDYDCFTIINEALFWKNRQILGLLWALGEKGENGAYLKIAKTLVPFTKALNEKLDSNPDLLGLWPAMLPSWPISKSSHKAYDHEHKRFLERLKVGETFPIRSDAGTRWIPNIITDWFIHLIEAIEWRRGWICDDSQLSDDLRLRLSKLGVFSSSTWVDWWDVAQELLEQAYVPLEEVEELKKWVCEPKLRNGRRESTRSRATNHKTKPPSQIRKFIYRALKEKFSSLSGSNKLKKGSDKPKKKLK